MPAGAKGTHAGPDLFTANRASQLERVAPLATRMRPRDLDDFVGQSHVVGPGTLLRRAIETDRLASVILWGPPGTGKTTLARIISHTTGAEFVALSAVTSGVADIRTATKEAADRIGMTGRRTVLFVDEIHRFNRSQQDAILPHVEDGTVILIGATTENPSFEVNAPLLSRSRVVVLTALADEDIRLIVSRALEDPVRGLGGQGITITGEAMGLLANFANGDGRFALNTLELAAAGAGYGAAPVITPEMVADAAQRRAATYDKTGDDHYDAISALHKTIRGSDPDAALYWLARMLERGDDPLFIARRLVRFASEDVGLADPAALSLAMAARDAVHFIGLPEGALALAELVVYLALAPKSNAIYRAYASAKDDVVATRNDPVPIHLRNAPTALMREQGYGAGYRYAHDFPDALVGQVNVPENVAGHRYYQPTGRGHEAVLAERLDRIHEAYRASRGEDHGRDRTERPVADNVPEEDKTP